MTSERAEVRRTGDSRFVRTLDGKVFVSTGTGIYAKEFAFALDEIDSPLQLLKHVHWLTERTWATRETIRGFVKAVCEAKGWRWL
jgi:hypothetical protein